MRVTTAWLRDRSKQQCWKNEASVFMPLNNVVKDALPHIVIVGGGAGGLELATLLGDSLGRQKQARITLVDKNRTFLWKPILHEIASGTIDYTAHEVHYLAQARWHHFHFHVGTMLGIERNKRLVQLAAHYDDEGNLITPRRNMRYDILVIAVGSRVNDFNTPGVADYAIQMDTAAQAARFHRKLVNACMRAHTQRQPLRPEQLKIAIVGGGATGVELAAELHHSIRSLVHYGLERVNIERDLSLTVIDSSPRILAALPERISTGATQVLQDMGVKLLVNTRVAEVTPTGVKLTSGQLIPAEIVVWAAGVRAPPFLKNIAGLETNHLDQLNVLSTLQTTQDPTIFAFGDCAATPWLGASKGSLVPARAQAAHQQALFLAKQLRAYVQGHSLSEFQYVDHGSVISLGRNKAIGGLAGHIIEGMLYLEGQLGRYTYDFLYKKQQLGLHGLGNVVLSTIGGLLYQKTKPPIKLH